MDGGPRSPWQGLGRRAGCGGTAGGTMGGEAHLLEQRMQARMVRLGPEGTPLTLRGAPPTRTGGRRRLGGSGRLPSDDRIARGLGR